MYASPLWIQHGRQVWHDEWPPGVPMPQPAPFRVGPRPAPLRVGGSFVVPSAVAGTVSGLYGIPGMPMMPGEMGGGEVGYGAIPPGCRLVYHPRTSKRYYVCQDGSIIDPSTGGAVRKGTAVWSKLMADLFPSPAATTKAKFKPSGAAAPLSTSTKGGLFSTAQQLAALFGQKGQQASEIIAKGQQAAQLLKTSGLLAKHGAHAAALASGGGTVAAHGAALAAAGPAIVAAMPWSGIAAAVVGVGVGSVALLKMRQRRHRALSGDERAIAVFIKKVAKWSAGKRTSVATKLLGQLQHAKRKKGKPAKGHVAVIEMKLAALYAVQRQAGAAPHEPVTDDPATVPAVVEANPISSIETPADTAMGTGPLGIPTGLLVGGGVAFGLLFLVLATARR